MKISAKNISLLIILIMISLSTGNVHAENSNDDKQYKVKRVPVYNPGGSRFYEKKEFYNAYKKYRKNFNKNDHNLDTTRNNNLKKVTNSRNGESYEIDMSNMHGTKIIDSKETKNKVIKNQGINNDKNFNVMQNNIKLSNPNKISAAKNYDQSKNILISQGTSSNSNNDPPVNIQEFKKDMSNKYGDLNQKQPLPQKRSKEKINMEKKININNNTDTKRNDDIETQDIGSISEVINQIDNN